MNIKYIIPGILLTLCSIYFMTINKLPVHTEHLPVAIYDPDKGHDTKVIHDLFGLIRAGMFGQMIKFLRDSGYNIEVLEQFPDKLSAYSSLVIINPRNHFTNKHKSEIWEFVKEGGGLLVMGDHTDIMGTQKPLNDLLSPIKVAFEFDSAFPLRKHWRYCQEFRPHPITNGINSFKDTQIGTGASLKVSKFDVEPIAIGRYSFGDYGNRANVGQGAFLGDYVYQPGERFGDMILVVSARYGEGRVIVFGDTTSFQNLAMPKAFLFVEQIFRYIVFYRYHGTLFYILLSFILFTGIGFIIKGYPSKNWIILITIVFLIGDMASGLVSRHTNRFTFTESNNLAIVDASHVPKFTLELFEDDSMGGLYTSLYRCGFFPILMEDYKSEYIKTAKMFVSITPSREFTGSELKEIRLFLENGGSILFLISFKEYRYVKEVLSWGGMEILNMPLGDISIKKYRYAKDAVIYNEIEINKPLVNVLMDEYTHPKDILIVQEIETIDMPSPEIIIKPEVSKIKFVEAWPVKLSNSMKYEVLGKWEDYVVAAQTTIGKGRLIVLADNRFLIDKNLEGEYDFNRENIEFFNSIINADIDNNE